MRRAVLLAAALGALAACGGGGGRAVATPRPVPDAMVPARIEAGPLAVAEYDKASDVFAGAGEESLVSRGRVWELRNGTELAGVLQVSTVVEKVDLSKSEHRGSIVRGILPSADEEEIAGVRVYTGEARRETIVVWFGEGLFEVLRIRAGGIDARVVAAELIAFQRASGALRPL